MSEMFCYQCQETAQNKGCTIKGVCGKEAKTSNLMDLLIYILQGEAIVNRVLRQKGEASIEADRQMLDALFSTITNANFDDQAIICRINKALAMKNELIGNAKKREIGLPDMPEIVFHPSEDEYEQVATKLGVLSIPNPNVRSMKEFCIYGVKGAAAYAYHACVLGMESDDLYEMMETVLSEVCRIDIDMDQLYALILTVGEMGVKAMELLDKANTSAYGNPEITKVNIGVGTNPGILISGHDLKDLETLLKQTEGKGIDVYTHSEMLPGHYYPAFKKYKHFIGNYGNSWWKQREEFESFQGPILFTTNCIVPPLESATYKDKVFTTGASGYPGWPHIKEAEKGKEKDFSAIIEKAKHCKPPKELENGELVGGFAHHQVLALSDKIVAAIKNGDIKKFVVMAGCDGRMKSREYYTEFAKALPKDTIILTAGCAKYRYNKLQLGDINGIPRVLDAGQCNDSYSLVRIALALKEALHVDDINKLPIVYNIAWYEQKAIVVLLSLLSLGIKNIHVGPTLPGFLTEETAQLFIKRFGLSGIDTVEHDIAKLIETK